MNHSAARIYLSSPHMGGEELNYVHDAFRKNWIAPLGANVDGFERDLENYTGSPHAAVVTSGTAAIHLALILCGVKAGDEVLCQSFTFSATANPIIYQGAKPVFIDSELQTWNMDPELLEQAIRDRLDSESIDREAEERGSAPRRSGLKWKRNKPRAIILVHLYGMPARTDRILQIAQKYNIPVIEDAAEALGSSIGGRKCGTFGKLSALSFNGNKIITTSGGGAVLSGDEGLIKQARFLATQARDDAPHYQHSELGYNYRMSNIVAGIGRGQMSVLEEHIAARRANHDFYYNALNGQWLEAGDSSSLFAFPPSGGSGIYFLAEPTGYYSNRWLSTILVNPTETGGITREDIRLALEQENIETRPLWKPMHLQPLYNDVSFYGNNVSEKLFEYGLCLPSGSNLTDEDRSRVVSAIKKVLNNVTSS